MRRPAKRRRIEKPADASAARRIGLQNIHRLRLQHLAEVPRRVSILARSDIHPGRRTFPDLAQPGQIVRTYRLLEPSNITGRKLLRKPERLGYRICAVAIKEQLHGAADRLAS